jgi:hypothetical protein
MPLKTIEKKKHVENVLQKIKLRGKKSKVVSFLGPKSVVFKRVSHKGIKKKPLKTIGNSPCPFATVF